MYRCTSSLNQMTTILKVFALALALVTGVALAQTGDPEYPGQTWKKSDPESLGWSRDGLRAADEFAKSIRSDAYLVIHKGQVVHEYGEVAKATNLHSVRKSVLSILTGIHADKGVVDLEKTVGALGLDDKDGLSVTEKKATVRHLLQARSGVYHPAAYETTDMAAQRPPRGSHPPGHHWYYNNWDFNALGTIFKGFTGKSVFDSLANDLAGPLQFEDFSSFFDTKWVYERMLSQYPAYEIRLSARDLGRVGLLMARRGRWKDQRIVSESWVTESTSSYSTAGPGIGYGYLWWVGIDGWHFGQKFPNSVFSARGYFGQFLVIDQARDLVIVHRVNSDKSTRANIGNRAFGELLGKILSAGPNLSLPR
jgi:CubicO group peptidase (beta-lactamase class C family)